MTLPWLIYTRVSTDEQASHGISLEAQLAVDRAYATARGWTIGEELTDAGYQAKNLKRPGYVRLLELIRTRKIAGFVVWRLDRVIRRMRDLVDLMALVGDDVGMVSVTEHIDSTTPIGRHMLHMLGSQAQLESETVGDRVRMAMGHLRERGYWLGRAVPAGCAVITTEDGKRKRLVRGEQADAVARAWPAVLAGDSLRQVCNRFKAEGIVPTARPGMETRTGWTPTTVRNLLLSPQVVGVLVDAALQNAVRQALANREAPSRKGIAQPVGVRSVAPSVLAGLLRCTSCDGAMVQVTATGNGGAYRYFRCAARIKGLCTQKDVRCEPIEAEAMVQLVAALAEDSPYCVILREDDARNRASLDALNAERIRLAGERDQIAARITHLTLHHQIGTSAWNVSMRALGAELDRIDLRAAELQGLLAAATVDASGLEMVLSRQRAGVAALADGQGSVAERTELFRLLVRRIRFTDEEVVLELYRPEPSASGGSYHLPGKLPRLHGLRTVMVRFPRVYPLGRPRAARTAPTERRLAGRP